MKRLFALLLAVLMLLSFAACGDKKPAGNDPATEEENDNAPSFTFTKFGKAKVTLRGAEFVKDDDDEDFLRVYIDYLNMDATAAGHSPCSALEIQATQNGEELDTDEFGADDECHILEDLLFQYQVQPGIPMRTVINIYCSPEDGIVDVALHAMIGSWAYNEEDVEWFKFQIDPANMMGAPKKAYEIKPIAQPTYAKDLPTSGTSTSGGNPFAISINGYELTTCDGQPALRVKMTYTHQHDWDMSPYSALEINAYQDGIALEQGSTWDLDDTTAEDEAYEAEITKGTTVECNAIFLLRGENPVEVVVEQPLDDLRAGITCQVNG